MQKNNIVVIVLSFIVILIYCICYLNRIITQFYKNKATKIETGIRYIAVGDSYTIGAGVEEDERWPNLVTSHLNKEGIPIQLVANLAVSGHTVKDVIDLQLEKVKEIRPDFVTVLIGANDNFGQIDAEIFQQELRDLLNRLQPMVTNPKNIILVTIPDYSKSPAVRQYQKEDIIKRIDQYNEIIKKEGIKKDLRVADIFPISQTMVNDNDYVSDGLHPSAISYVKWERIIFPVVYNLLKNSIIQL